MEPFIEVNSLNKLKRNDKIQDIIDEDDGYLILGGYLIKADKYLLETNEKLPAEESEMDDKDNKCREMLLIEPKMKF